MLEKQDLFEARQHGYHTCRIPGIYNEFKSSYNEKYQKKYGFFRWEVDKEADKLLRCGIPEYGIARITIKFGRLTRCYARSVAP